jgi:hypothetical protein
MKRQVKAKILKVISLGYLRSSENRDVGTKNAPLPSEPASQLFR